MQKQITITMGVLLSNFICFAQDKVDTHTLNYDPESLKIIPDKYLEIGIPLLAIFFLLNAVIVVLKNRAEQRLKLKMIEKGVSEDALIKIFKESNAIAKLQPLKWFLFIFSIALAFLCIHFTRDFLINQSGYLAVGIFLLFISAAFIIYYNILSKKIN
ncbi:MAG: hypothetical protein NT040_00890 [Bacteroidetes bacterium]|nr:hypothetical protein [Bacteroidota bacterium]